jgi:hypothetical protein
VDPGFGMGKNSRPGSGMNIPDHISESLKILLELKILKFFDADPDPGSGNFLILDPVWKQRSASVRYFNE